MDFSDKTVVLTGGLGRIGIHVARAFAEYHAKVIIADIDESRFKELIRTGVFMGDRHIFSFCDISQPEVLRDTITKLKKENGEIHAWINLAYPRTPDWGGKFEDLLVESWDQNIKMHLGGYFWSSKFILEEMKKQKKGSLINFGSIYGMVGPQFSIYQDLPMTMPVAYAAIKGAITNLSRYFAALYGPYNIRVNTLCPGGVFDEQDEKFVARYSALTPLKRMARVEELAMPTLFLASDAASYITGHTLMVDGGWTAW